jgi:hypothetical protein
MALVWGKEVRLMSSAEKIMGKWDHLIWVLESSTATWLMSLYESRCCHFVRRSALAPPTIVRIDA